MRVAIITDTHYGARKGSRLFHDYFEKFYNDIFFPTLEKEKITHVIHMGDAFDSRKGIEFKSLDWAKRVVFEPLKKMGITMDLMVGNHDAYYKNTNSINAVELLLKEYDNVITYSSATEVEIDGRKLLYIPWICEDNEDETYEQIILNDTLKDLAGRQSTPGAAYTFVNWWAGPRTKKLRQTWYGAGEGLHATPSEIAVTQFARPRAMKPLRRLDPAPTSRSIGTAENYRATYPDGRMGSDPSLATPEAGRELIASAVTDIAEHYRDFVG